MKGNPRPKDSHDIPFRIIIKLLNEIQLAEDSSAKAEDFPLKSEPKSFQAILKRSPPINITKLFTSLSPAKISRLAERASKMDCQYQPPNFNAYYAVTCTDRVDADRLLQMMLEAKDVELAYVETGPLLPPSVNPIKNPLIVYQGYLNKAPGGVDAHYARNFKGGYGEGKVKFIDIEQGWILNHEDITVGTFPDTGLNRTDFQDHGTAVLGTIMMLDNKLGGIGMTPNVNGYVVSQWRPDGSFNTADAIMTAINHRKYGDILLLQTQAFDPAGSDFAWPVEIQNAVFEVIALATALGIVVIEPAGNGNLNSKVGSDLDGFAIAGEQRLKKGTTYFRDSGAIIVAAASNVVPHLRMGYSNFGSRIDCYSWGERITTAGYVPLSSGEFTDTYTGRFGGTSGASAIIAGVAIIVQSIIELNFGCRIGPKQMRDILSSDMYNTASSGGRAKDKIGVMPDLRKIIQDALGVKKNIRSARNMPGKMRIDVAP